MDLGITLFGFLIAGVVKIAVMFLSGLFVVRMFSATHLSKREGKLWLLIPKEDISNFKILYVSLILFFLSELFCGVESYIIFRSHPLIGYLHSAFSSLGQGFFAIALFEIFNDRLIFFGEKNCLMNRICRGCTHAQGDKCKFSTLSLLLASLLFLATIPPFFSSIETIYADPARYILPFESLNYWFDHKYIPFIKSIFPGYIPVGIAFYVDSSVQFLDSRIIPSIVMVLSVVAIALLRKNNMGPKKIGMRLLLFASGMLGYTYVQLILYRVIGDIFLGAFAHELSELMFLLLLQDFLHQSFGSERQQKTKAAA